MASLKCPWCKYIGSSEGLREHLKDVHFLTYPVASEISYITTDEGGEYCYKCGAPKTPLTFITADSLKVPCWDCLSSKEQRGFGVSIREEIKDYYQSVLTDRYLQLFLLDPIYFDSTLPHNYQVFKGILSKLDLPNRNAIWFVDWKLGWPRIISSENIQGIEIKDLGKLYKIEEGKDFIQVNKYRISAPVPVKYDQIHHGRYNIFNPGGTRNSKRIRLLKSDQCYRLFNNEGRETWKSLLQITDLSGHEVEISKISPLDLLTLKLCLMRNKSIMRVIFQVLETALEQVTEFKDEVFLRNTITLEPKPSKDKTKVKNLHFRWTPGEDEEENENLYPINISIL